MMSIQSNEYVSNITTPQSNNDDVLLFRGICQLIEKHKVKLLPPLISEFNQDSYVSNEVALEIERAQNFFHYSLNERESEFERIIVTGESTDQILEPLKERMGSEGIVRIDYRSILNHDFTNENLLDSCSVAIGLAMRANEINKRK